MGDGMRTENDPVRLHLSRFRPIQHEVRQRKLLWYPESKKQTLHPFRTRSFIQVSQPIQGQVDHREPVSFAAERSTRLTGFKHELVARGQLESEANLVIPGHLAGPDISRREIDRCWNAKFLQD